MSGAQPEVEPFKIHVPQDVLDDLAWRLDHARFPHDFRQ